MSNASQTKPKLNLTQTALVRLCPKLVVIECVLYRMCSLHFTDLDDSYVYVQSSKVNLSIVTLYKVTIECVLYTFEMRET
jgi:hypothetical protein